MTTVHRLLLTGVLTTTLVGCDTSGSPSIAAAGELRAGDMDPNAPEGWPLAIGDPNTVPVMAAGGVEESFEFWEHQCCISWVDGAPYTAKWRAGEKDGQPWHFYEGHVPATPPMSAADGARRRLAEYERGLAEFARENPEEFSSPAFQEGVAEYREAMRSRIVRYEEEGR